MSLLQIVIKLLYCKMDKMRLLMEDERPKVQFLHKTNPEVGEEVTELWFGEEYKCEVVEKEDMLRVKVH